MGVPLRTLYGQTELLGAYTLHPARRRRSRHHRRCRWPTASRSASTSRTPTASARSSCAIPTCSSAITRTEGHRRRHARRLDAFRRCRLFQRRQAARRHRPHQGSRRDRARRPLLAAIHREQAEILALYRRGRGAGRRPRLSGGDDLHPLFDRLEMGGEEPHLVHDLHRSRLAARGLRAAAQGGRERSTPHCRRRSASPSSCCSTRSSTPTTAS